MTLEPVARHQPMRPHVPALLAALGLAIVGCAAPAVPSNPVPASHRAPASAPPSAAGSDAPSPVATSSTAAAAWIAAAPMPTGRYGFDAVLLGDGTVLAVGDDYSRTRAVRSTGASERSSTTRLPTGGSTWRT